MTDFFDQLETDLRAAALRRPRPNLVAVPVVAAGLVVALAVGATALVLGGDGGRGGDRVSGTELPPVGTVVHRHGERYTVVATGTTPVSGPWQVVAYRSARLSDPESGEVYQPAGLRCLGIYVPKKFEGGQCGEFPRTPGFSSMQARVGDRLGKPKEELVYGRVPERAAAVIVQRPGRRPLEVRPLPGPASERGDFYMVALRPGTRGRVNWVDRNGNLGSRGIGLTP